MKNRILYILLPLLWPMAASAHEGGSTSGLFGFPPEYIHVLINPLPTYGVAIGIFVVLVGLVTRSVAARNAGLFVIFFCTGIVWAVVHYGDHAFDHLKPTLDPASVTLANVHMDRAESFVYVFYATALLSAIALAIPMFAKAPTVPSSPTPAGATHPETRRAVSKAGTIFVIIALICAIVSFALGTWISRAGGRIRHPEFREGQPATNAVPEHTHEHH